MPTKTACSIDGCGGPRKARGWCVKHYTRWQKYADPLHVMRVRGCGAEPRFWPKVDKDDSGGCWLWTATCDQKGYGHFFDGHRSVKAHRFSYELLVGPIPEGLVVDHLCRVRNCVNPAHLEPVTGAENVRRGIAGRLSSVYITECRRGHPLAGENLYVNPRGERQCRTCMNAATARYHRRRREAQLAVASGGTP